MEAKPDNSVVPEPHRAYWEVSLYATKTKSQLQEMLKQRGMTATKRMNKAKLARKALYFDLGKVDYDACKRSELVRFARDRGLLSSTLKLARTGAGRLIQLLEQADESPCLEGFKHLPAEVRNIIVTYYVDSLPSNPNVTSPPPLAQICKQMRQELVPVFYHRSIFVNISQSFRMGASGHEYTTIGDLARMKKLQLSLAEDVTSKLRRVRIVLFLDFSGLPDARPVLRRSSHGVPNPPLTYIDLTISADGRLRAEREKRQDDSNISPQSLCTRVLLSFYEPSLHLAYKYAEILHGEKGFSATFFQMVHDYPIFKKP